jgi:hypothetical protein
MARGAAGAAVVGEARRGFGAGTVDVAAVPWRLRMACSTWTDKGSEAAEADGPEVGAAGGRDVGGRDVGDGDVGGTPRPAGGRALCVVPRSIHTPRAPATTIMVTQMRAFMTDARRSSLRNVALAS